MTHSQNILGFGELPVPAFFQANRWYQFVRLPFLPVADKRPIKKLTPTAIRSEGLGLRGYVAVSWSRGKEAAVAGTGAGSLAGADSSGRARLERLGPGALSAAAGFDSACDRVPCASA